MYAIRSYYVREAVAGQKLFRSISRGMLVQDEDEGLDTEFKTVTKKEFEGSKMNLAQFGTVACKHLKSNAIAVVTENENGAFFLALAVIGVTSVIQEYRVYSSTPEAGVWRVGLALLFTLAMAVFGFHSFWKARKVK